MTKGQALEKEILLRASAGQVWAALTEGDQLAAWFGAKARLELRPGGRAIFRWPDGSTRGATVVAVEAERLLILRWLPWAEDARGRRRPQPGTTLGFVLRTTPEGTRLNVTESAPGAHGLIPGDRPPEMDAPPGTSQGRGGPLARAAR